jgi:hypothetical protein
MEYLNWMSEDLGGEFEIRTLPQPCAPRSS